MNIELNKSVFLLLLAMFVSSSVFTKEIHVAKTGNDSGFGTRSAPFLTITKASEIAEAGDEVIVHEGIYREWVKPTRGGNSEEARIIYKVADGDEVYIKGSERITNWESLGGGIWKVEFPNTYFGDYNPYELRVSEKYMTDGQWHHRGDVYINGKGLYEKQIVSEVFQFRNRWHCKVESGSTTITANFNGANPNEEVTEIALRESVFTPMQSGLSYITISGFHIMHAASNWVPPSAELQIGAITPRMGKRWIIENCTISDNRTVGIALGRDPDGNYSDIESYGDHVVRNNIISRCGHAGIIGSRGPTRSLIEGNLIENINDRREFGGHETAGIKFHHGVDVVIKNNLIRNIYKSEDQAAFGIWIDFGNQGTRITGNIIYNTGTETIFMEMNHGPSLIDNNILVGKRGIASNSEATIMAHNLFVNCSFGFSIDTERKSTHFKPHTTIEYDKSAVVIKDDKWFNNIFIEQGISNISASPGYESDYNVFYEGAEKSSFGDKNSVKDLFETSFLLKETKLGVNISFFANGAPFNIETPMVDKDLIGVFELTAQTIEDRDGAPIIIDRDFNGRKFKTPVPGPLSELKKGNNRVSWLYLPARQ